MAFPTIPTAGNGRLLTGTQANETATRTFPAFSGLTYADGDLLIAVVVAYRATGASNATWSGWSNGFTERLDVGTVNATDTSATMSIGVATKVASGTEAGSLTVTQAATVDGDAMFFLMAIQGWGGVTLPEYQTAFSAASVADPGALNPAAWGTEDVLWIAIGGSGEISTTGAYDGMGAGTLTNYGNIVNLTATGDAQGKVDGAIGFRQNATASEDVGTWATPDTSNARNCALVIAVRGTRVLTPVAETDTALTLSYNATFYDLGGVATETDLANEIIPLQPLPATETDTAVALTVSTPIRKTITEAAETDTAQALVVTKPIRVTVTQAAETDTAQTVSASKFLTPALETDTAQTVSASKFLTPAAETDSAQTISAGKFLTPAAETDTAQPITIQAGGYDIEPALETDTAQARTASKAVAATVATETDLANEIIPLQPLPALETDTAQPLTVEQGGLSLTPATETDTAQAVTFDQPYGISPALETDTVSGLYANKVLVPATETDSALVLSAAGNKSITPVLETDSAQALDVDKAETITQAAETDTAQAVDVDKRVTLTNVSETDTAQAVTFSGPIAKTIVPVEETDSARTLVVTKPIFKTITFVSETDTAQPVDKDKGVTLTAAVSTNTAQALDADKRLSLSLVAETDTAINLGVGGAFSIDTVTETNAALSLSYGILPPTGAISGTRTGRLAQVKTGRIARPREGALV